MDFAAPLLGQIRSLIYRRYASGDGVARAFLQFNRERDGWLDAAELRSGLGRLFGLRVDPAALWRAFDLDNTARPGKLSLEEFAVRLEARGGVSLVDTGMSSGVHAAAETPRQDDSASFRHLRAAAGRDPSRLKNTAATAAAAAAAADADGASAAMISSVVKKLQRTEMSMRTLFREMDASHNKRLDAQELLGAMRACGAATDDFGITEARTVLAAFDRDRDGNLTFSDFVRLLAFTEKEEDEREHAPVAAAAAPPPLSRRKAERRHCSPPAFIVPGAVRAAAARASASRAAVSVSHKMGLSSCLSSKEYRAIKQISDAVYGSRRKVRQLFRMMDNDGDRQVDAAELQAGLSECGLEMNLEDVSVLVQHFAQESGKLSYSKFIKLLAAKE